MKLNEFEKSANLAFRTAYIIFILALINACAPVTASIPKEGHTRPPTPTSEPEESISVFPQVYEVEVCKDLSGDGECDPDEPPIGNVFVEISSLSSVGTVTKITVDVNEDGFGMGDNGDPSVDFVDFDVLSREKAPLRTCFDGTYQVIRDRTADGEELQKVLFDFFPVLCKPEIG